MRRCPNCGEENPERFRLCGFCGTPLAPQEPAAEVRKTVTIVFCDLKGSTDLGERVDPETMREGLGRYFEAMQAILQKHGGTVEKYIGDAIMAVFGLPLLHEDDALRAVRAATEMRSALRELNVELERRWGVQLTNRIGVNTGEVVAGDVSAGQRFATGDAVNVAARLEAAAPPNEILIGATTYRLVREATEVEPVAPLALKGKSEPVPAYRLISVRDTEWFSRRLEAPLVGREHELQELLDAFELASRERRLQIATVLGHAGLGKTRLTAEFLERLPAAAWVLRGRCLSYGNGMTFWPIAQMVRGASGVVSADTSEVARAKIDELLGEGAHDVAERLAAAIGLSTESFPLHETFWAMRRFIEILAARRPLVFVFDDIHWAAPTLLDLIDHLADATGEAPALILCAARHDLFDDRTEWLEKRKNATRIVLQSLSPEESAHIIDNLLGSAGLPVRVRDRIISAADGNPLFVEQMLSMLIDDGVLRRDANGEWTVRAEISTIAVPVTISALLAARLERLPEAQRAILDTASVTGVLFYEAAVRELVPASTREGVSTSVIGLTRKQLIRPDVGAMLGNERAFRFGHVLIRDTAYQRLLKRRRADLHERFAAWLERMLGLHVAEYEEIVGYHIEQAFRYLTELGPPDEHATKLGLRGSIHLASAGAKASGRGDMPATANLIERAMSLRDGADPVGIEWAVDLADALREMGEFDRARAVVTKALEAAGPTADQRLLMSLRLVELLVERSTAPVGWAETAQRDSEQAVAIFEQVGDHVGLARAFRLLATIHGIACRYGPAQQAVERAVHHARLAGDRRQETRSLAPLALCALLSPQSAEEAIALCERLAEETSVDRRAQSGVLYSLAPLYAMRGDFDRARATYRRAQKTLEEIGDRRLAAFTALYAARVELLAGEPAAVETELRPAYETLRQAGERNFVPTAAALLAEAAYLRAQDEEAEALTRVSEELASASDIESQYRWRCVRAKVLARAGRAEEAIALAEAALALVLATDGPTLQADAYSALAEVRERAGDHEGDEAALRRAEELYALKGDVVSAARVSAKRSALVSSHNR